MEGIFSYILYIPCYKKSLLMVYLYNPQQPGTLFSLLKYFATLLGKSGCKGANFILGCQNPRKGSRIWPAKRVEIWGPSEGNLSFKKKTNTSWKLVFYPMPRESKDQTLPIGSRESFIWIILKTILCLVLDLDFQGMTYIPRVYLQPQAVCPISSINSMTHWNIPPRK